MKMNSYPVTQHDILTRYKIREIIYDFKPYLKISFTLNMKAGVKYYIAYSEVYTYSMLLNDIEYLQTNWKAGFNQHITKEQQKINELEDEERKKKLQRRLDFQKSLTLDLKYIKSFTSLSGLKIPFLKIRYSNRGEAKKTDEEREKQNQESDNQGKILIIGRVHPGESNSSILMQGLLYQLIYTQKYRNNFVEYHIIPMINVDGVIIGNFRTSLYGLDLNR